MKTTVEPLTYQFVSGGDALEPWALFTGMFMKVHAGGAGWWLHVVMDLLVQSHVVECMYVTIEIDITF